LTQPEVLIPQFEYLEDPFLMPDLRLLSIDLIAIRPKRILIYGDYDVDGTTAVVILARRWLCLGLIPPITSRGVWWMGTE
jgi:single-stranded DNA-specific DHH superfamily exonuclease